MGPQFTELCLDRPGEGVGGSVLNALLKNNLDIRALRPYEGDDGNTYIDRFIGNEEQSLIVNNPVTQGLLRKNDWLLLDEAILKAAKPRLRFVGDLRGEGLIFTIPEGMAKPILQYERQSDITPATISMSGLRQSEEDRPFFDLNNLPLPIIHKDFSFDLRQLAASRTGYSPLDTTTAELAGRRVAEEVEKLSLGTRAAYSFGGGVVYGATNFPSRITGSLTQKPFVSSALNASWNPTVTLNDVLAMKTASQQHFHFGPWMIYVGLAWDQYMDQDYVNVGVGTTNARVGNSMTLRQRLRMIDNIIDVRTLDFLPQGTAANPAFDIVMVQFTPEVVRMVMGMDITTIQWETHGGLELHFKVLCIMIPHLRADMNNNTGIVHYN